MCYVTLKLTQPQGGVGAGAELGNRENNGFRGNGDNWDSMENKENRKCMKNISDVWK